MNPYMKNARKAAKDFLAKPWRQGWMWAVTIDASDAPKDFDIYVKDIDYGEGSIDADTVKIGSGHLAFPTAASASEITLTVRDDQFNTIANWFDAQLAKVRNKDGTLNIPIDYVFDIHIHDLDEDGNRHFRKSYTVFPTKKGNLNFSRENHASITSFPIIFQKFSSVGNGLKRTK